MTDPHRSNWIHLAASLPEGSSERRNLLRMLKSRDQILKKRDRSTRFQRVVFHAVAPATDGRPPLRLRRDATVVKAYVTDEGGFYFEEIEGNRAPYTVPDPVSTKPFASKQELVKDLNNHFRRYRQFEPRDFKVLINELGIRV